MKRFLILLLVVITGVAGRAGIAAIYPWDAIDWTGQYITKIKFTNYEVIWSAADGKFKDASYTPQLNDVVYQILTATSIIWETPEGDIPKWTTSDAGELTAYAVAKITSISSNVYTFGPFGEGQDQLGYNWGADEVVALYFDANKDFTANSSNRVTDRQFATDGVLFATFGFGAALDVGQGGATGTPYLNSTVLRESPLLVLTEGALNVKQLSPGYGGVVFLPLDQGTEPYSSTLSSSITVANPANTNWPLKSEDPFRIRPTPEPGATAALLSLAGAAGVIGLLRRRRAEEQAVS